MSHMLRRPTTSHKAIGTSHLASSTGNEVTTMSSEQQQSSPKQGFQVRVNLNKTKGAGKPVPNGKKRQNSQCFEPTKATKYDFECVEDMLNLFNKLANCQAFADKEYPDMSTELQLEIKELQAKQTAQCAAVQDQLEAATLQQHVTMLTELEESWCNDQRLKEPKLVARLMRAELDCHQAQRNFVKASRAYHFPTDGKREDFNPSLQRLEAMMNAYEQLAPTMEQASNARHRCGLLIDAQTAL